MTPTQAVQDSLQTVHFAVFHQEVPSESLAPRTVGALMVLDQRLLSGGRIVQAKEHPIIRPPLANLGSCSQPLSSSPSFKNDFSNTCKD